MAAFLVMLREGVEAALIVAILLAYLDRMRRTSERRWVWGGTLSAVVVSLVVGALLWLTIGGLEGTAEQLTEGLIALAAAGLLTWMIFWMGRQARTIRRNLEYQADTALAAGGAVALATIAFIAVLREGLESSLFLISTTVGESAGGGQLAGALLGVAGAVVIGYLMYKGSHLIDLRKFFRVTGLLIVLFAAGLVSKGVHEFQEAGLIPILVDPVWTVNVFDPATSLTGEFLKSVFGWRTSPSLLTVLSYLAYLLPVGWSFWAMTAAVPANAGKVREPAAG